MNYIEKMTEQIKILRQKERITVLGIESSCDETSAAIVINGRRILSNVISSQIEIHRKYKGVVPEIASRCHTECIASVTEEALHKANITFSDIDAVAVTAGPGLVGGLLVGVSYAKALAYAINVPLIGVHHIEGHICANYISHSMLEPPFVALIASGGHSHIILAQDYCSYRLLGRTRDDAAGEAFDKTARVLGLPYPGGVEIERLAVLGDPDAFVFHSTIAKDSSYDFSFSGVKTAVINLVHKYEQKGEAMPAADLAASFQAFVVKTLCDKAIRAATEHNVAQLVLAGGVSANSLLRKETKRLGEERGLHVYYPERILCTDNAAMIASAGYFRLLRGEFSDLDLNANPNMVLF